MTEVRGPGWFTLVFGTGPRGAAVSLASLALADWLKPHVDLPTVHGHAAFGLGALAVGVVLTVAGVIWSVKSLPPKSRGRDLVTSGAFHYVRHPLYAAFLLCFNVPLALALDDWVFVLWALAQWPIWHVNVVAEERLMRGIFGPDYDAYCRRTGRFMPKLSAFSR